MVSLRLNGLRAVNFKTISNYIYCSGKNCQIFGIFLAFKLRENGLLLEVYANSFDLLTAQKVKFFIKDFVHCLSLWKTIENQRFPIVFRWIKRDSLNLWNQLVLWLHFTISMWLFPSPFSILDQLYGIITYILGCYIFRCPWHEKMVTCCYRYCQSYVVFGTGKSLLSRICFLQIFGVSILFLLSRNIYSFQLMSFLVDPLTSNVPILVAAECRERGSRLTFACSINRKNKNTWKRCEICSKLIIKTPELYFTPFSSVSIVDSEQVNVSWDGIEGNISMKIFIFDISKCI